MLETDLSSPISPDENDRLAGPVTTFTHPDDVLHSPSLTVADKRRILAAWASDAHAVPNRPALRQLDSGAVVGIDTILAALRTLDARNAEPGRSKARSGVPANNRLSLITRWRRMSHGRGEDDDNDPPPCPASRLPPGVEIELRRRRDAEWNLAAA